MVNTLQLGDPIACHVKDTKFTLDGKGGGKAISRHTIRQSSFRGKRIHSSYPIPYIVFKAFNALNPIMADVKLLQGL